MRWFWEHRKAVDMTEVPPHTEETKKGFHGELYEVKKNVFGRVSRAPLHGKISREK